MNDDFDFTKPANTSGAAAPPPAPPVAVKSKMYNAAVARKLFELGGTPEQIAAGGTFFVEHEKAGKGGLFSKAVPNKMFFLNTGEVALTAGGRVLDTIRSGEIFGEMAVITGGARSATATARTDCSGYSLDAAQFQAAIQRMPEFALMLMSVMFDRLRLLAARLAARKTAAPVVERETAVFDAATLTQLHGLLEQSATLRYQRRQVIMREGEAGAYMYIVLEGSVAISINGTVVETVRVGGTFGEMALVDQSPRTASATAPDDCALLAINRAALLSLVKAQPGFGMALLKSVADRLRHMNSLLA